MNTHDVLEKATKYNIPEGHCYFCKKPIISGRKNQKYHSGCQYDAHKYDIKAKFKNHTYMYIYCGTGYERGQGTRSGSLIKGAMSVAQDIWSNPVLVTRENIDLSLQHYSKINLCNGAWLNKEEAYLLAYYLQIKCA